ncbi:MAG: hypothetical protein ACLQM8_09750 [Limisphaerales bacterium]
MKSSLFPPPFGPPVRTATEGRLATGIRRPVFPSGTFALAVAAAVFLPLAAPAFPPAPHHLIYGTVRDEYGTPLMTSQAQVILTTPTGVWLTAAVAPGIAFDENFELDVPMDAGLTPDPYEPSALLPSAPFTMLVVIGETTNVPIQMTTNYLRMGQPAQETRIDLTLGTDTNGDGIPDQWELEYLAAIGSSLNLTNLTAGMRLGPGGLTLLQQFLLGTYPFDPQQPFVLRVVALNEGSPLLQFTTMTGRYYTLYGSADLTTWTPLNFLVPTQGASGTAYSYYFAQGIQTVQIQAVQPATGPTMRFFRMQLQ